MSFRGYAQRFRALVNRTPLPTVEEARLEMRQIAALAIAHYKRYADRGVHGFNPDIVRFDPALHADQFEDRILLNDKGDPRILDIENDLRNHCPDRIPNPAGVPIYTRYINSAGVVLGATSGPGLIVGDTITTIVEYLPENWRPRAGEFAEAMDCLAELAGEDTPRPKLPINAALEQLETALIEYIKAEADSGNTTEDLGIWIGHPVHDAVVDVQNALEATKLPDPALQDWKRLLRHCRSSAHWPQGWPPEELWESAKALRDWARDERIRRASNGSAQTKPNPELFKPEKPVENLSASVPLQTMIDEKWFPGYSGYKTLREAIMNGTFRGQQDSARKWSISLDDIRNPEAEALATPETRGKALAERKKSSE